MFELAKRLYPICRSITGNGVRESLKIIKEAIGNEDFTIHEVPTGTKVFDWTIPKEWNIKGAYIDDWNGNRIVDFRNHNLHVVGYSLPMDVYLTLDELKEIVYTRSDQPDVIPYVTSYYKERSGFCMSENLLQSLSDEGKYHCVIDSELKDGSLSYGELILPGQTNREILLSTYICHPSMANNELSGGCVMTELARWLQRLETRKYTYRIVIAPETIGALTYLSKNYETMHGKVDAGFILSCCGDERTYSYVQSRYGDTLTDRLLENVLSYQDPNYHVYNFLQRGSDERQYNAPGIDIPVCTLCRTKYGEYPEYHTSADDLTLISEQGMQGTLEVMQKCITALENNGYYRVTCLGEPQLGRRGLYPTLSTNDSGATVRLMMNVIAYCDGRNDLIDLSDRLGVPINDIIPIIHTLTEHGVLVDKE